MVNRTWKIIFIKHGFQGSVLIKGNSAIIEENNWRNLNPDKTFIQIQLYK